MSGHYVLPADENLAIAGPFPDHEHARQFGLAYLADFGFEIRDGCEPADWVQVHESEQEDE